LNHWAYLIHDAAGVLADGEVRDEREPTAAELLEWRRDDVFHPEADACPEEYPHLRNISSGFMFGGMVRPLEPPSPEYATLSMSGMSHRTSNPSERSPHPVRVHLAAVLRNPGSGNPDNATRDLADHRHDSYDSAMGCCGRACRSWR
jgi:hypothetical protein